MPMNSVMVRVLKSLALALLCIPATAQDLVTVRNADKLQSLGMSAIHAPNSPDSLHFRPIGKDIPVYSRSNIDQWISFSIYNATSEPTLFLTARAPNAPLLILYRGKTEIYRAGNTFPFAQRAQNDVDFVANLRLRPGDTATYFLHVVSNHPLVLPLVVGTQAATDQAGDSNIFILGAYFGILLVIFFYNLFLYFSVKDRNYLYYIIYVFLLGMAQLASSGFAFKYCWPNYPGLNNYMVVLFSGLVCIMAIVFAIYFLQIRKYAPRIMFINTYFLVTYSVAIVGNWFGANWLSYNILDINGFFMAVYVITVSAYIAAKGFRAAYFYLLAWSIFMVGLIFYVLKNYGILSSSIFSNYALYIGSSLEAVLLSIALADKINELKREKEASQEQALEVARENEQIVKNQNLLLEAKVHERTEELEKTNLSLNNALDHLKSTQSQLVESEKMASLGVLTAGIAHEINNPINFVKSNIKPLQLDIKDLLEIITQYESLDPAKDFKTQIGNINSYKSQVDIPYIRQEISSLLQGIEDGAARTAEIVRGLRTFSRLDETELKKVSLHEGLDSTLVLLRSNMPVNVQVVREYATVPAVECFPGKLNQVFMNIMSNAVYAMDKKHSGQTETLTVGTILHDPDHVMVRIADTGIGMQDSIKEKIFDPFFTTKEIGEGTGLGLSIVFSIIEKHKGKVLVHSTPGVGTEFQIILPINHPSN